MAGSTQPKAITKHTALGLPTLAADSTTPVPSTPFTLNWTVPGFKQQSYTTVKLDCVPNYSDGPNLTEGGQDVTAQNKVDGSGNASGSLQVTVSKPEQYIFSLTAQGTAGNPVTTHFTVTAGGDANIQFGLNGQAFKFTAAQWKAFYSVTLESAKAAFDAHLAGMSNWRDSLNQLNGIDSTVTTKDSSAYSSALDALKRAGKAIAGSTIMAFSGNTILEPNFAYNTTRENVYAALTKVDAAENAAQDAADALTAAQAAMNDGINRMAAYDAAIQTGGARAIVAIGVVKDAALIALSVTPAGLGATALQAAFIAAGETAVEKGTSAALDWHNYTAAKFGSDVADVIISFFSAYLGGKAADELATKIGTKMFKRAMTEAETNTVKGIISNIVTDYCNNLGNTLKAAVTKYNTQDDWHTFLINLKWDAIVGALPPEVRADKS